MREHAVLRSDARPGGVAVTIDYESGRLSVTTPDETIGSWQGNDLGLWADEEQLTVRTPRGETITLETARARAIFAAVNATPAPDRHGGSTLGRATRWLRLAALFGFALPFLTVSCMGEHLTSPTGIELAFGIESEISPEFEGLEELSEGRPESDPEYEVLAALVLSAVAAVFGFGRSWWITAAVSMLTVGLLIYWWTDISSEFSGGELIGLDISIGFGLWVVWVLLTTASVIDFLAGRNQAA